MVGVRHGERKKPVEASMDWKPNACWCTAREVPLHTCSPKKIENHCLNYIRQEQPIYIHTLLLKPKHF